VTGGSAAIAAWTMRRALEPVESMAALAQDWSERDLEGRFDRTRGDDETLRLGHTLNVLLDCVAGALRNEQRLTAELAELADELRTPLTAIRGDAELSLMASSSANVTERMQRIIDVVDRMSTTIGSLLSIARDVPRADARTTAPALVSAALALRADASDITISTDDVGEVAMAVPAAPPYECWHLSPRTRSGMRTRP
jgi:two-component system OmpR family sensor kinase